MKALHYSFSFDIADNASPKVFQDESRKRRSWLRKLVSVLSLSTFIWMGVFYGRMLDGSESFLIPEASHQQTQNVILAASGLGFGSDAVTSYENVSASTPVECAPNQNPPFSVMAQVDTARALFLHLPAEIPWSHLSLPKACDRAIALAPEWFHVTSGLDGLELEIADEHTQKPVWDYLSTLDHTPVIVPVVSFHNLSLEQNLGRSLGNALVTQDLVKKMVNGARSLNVSGLCFDYTGFPVSDYDSLEYFARVTAAALETAGLSSCAIVNADQPLLSEESLTNLHDTIVVQAFQNPWIGSPPSPLASQTWFEDTLKDVRSQVPENQLIIALSSHAVDWVNGDPEPAVLPYQQAMARQSFRKDSLVFDASVGNSFSATKSLDGKYHRTWYLDALSFHNQVVALENAGLFSIAVWNIGFEDPGIWEVLNASPKTAALEEDYLQQITLGEYVDYQGEGPFMRVVSPMQPGRRDVTFDQETGNVFSATLMSRPLPYRMEKFGQPTPEKLVLTFDDGPDPEFTTQILDDLSNLDVKASFFVVGRAVMGHPDILRRMFDEGHEVGLHTFTHPRMDKISEYRREIEINSSQNLINSVANRGTIFYREPFQRSGGPIAATRVQPLEALQSRGYLIAGMDIVPKDWTGLSANEIVEYVVNGVLNGEGNVILLHDGGGADRSASVKAVPGIVRELRALGYEFTTLSDLVGKPLHETNPVVEGSEVVFDRVSFLTLSTTMIGIVWIFWIVLVIGVCRSLLLLVLSAFRRRNKCLSEGFAPKVCIVIPAFNETKVIQDCVNAALASDYENLQVMVVDDGSFDNTIDKLLVYRNNPRVRVLSQCNQGKWCALNRALEDNSAEIVVSIDADTIICPDAVRHMVRHFQDSRVGAVAGKVIIGNQTTLLTRLQSFEYTIAHTFERRAFDLVNGIMVVPGAIGAWRVEALRQVGGYSHQTMTEDCDMTLSVIRAGYRVTYEENARAFTEAPDTVSSLLAQRLRWTLGMLQSSWKHKWSIFEGRSIGWITIPDTLVFGYLFPLLAPIVDLFLLILLFNFLSSDWSGEVGTSIASTPDHLLLAYLALPAIDFLLAFVAVLTDRDAKLRSLWLFPLQRFYYRQIMYFSVYRALHRAATGKLASWNKLRRSGQVSLAQARRA